MKLRIRMVRAILIAAATSLVLPAHARQDREDVQQWKWDFDAGEMRPSPPKASDGEARKPRPETRRDERPTPRPVFRSDPDRGREHRADRRERDRRHADEDRRHRPRDRYDRPRGESRVDYRRDHRHRVEHRRHWAPRVGVAVPSLPWGYREIRHHRHNYFFADGYWFEPWGSSYVRIGAPVGVVVSALPAGYVSLNLGSTMYYRYADTWYRPHTQGYVVVDAPAGAPAGDLEPPDDDTLFAYPNQGQDEAQQAEDRFECHEWAAGQTGYDPSRTSPAGATTASLRKRPDYLRAMTACLEGRGYTVR
ncbi:MAG: hypothetical protein KDH20_07450 [Rhodocyclaceae bacterium]|nr:hypothetical protein [Rhodocyclaceae bacterium]